MKRIVSIVVLGLGGLLVAVGITLGALALAGDAGDAVDPGLQGPRLSPSVVSPSAQDADGGSWSPSWSPSGNPSGGSDSPEPSHDDSSAEPSHDDSSDTPEPSHDDSSGTGHDDSSGSGSEDHSDDDD